MLGERPEIAARCSEDGTIAEVFRNELALHFIPGYSLAGVVSATSRSKINNFLHTVLGCGAALDWEVDVAFARGVASLFFSGCRTTNGINLIGSTESRSAEDLRAELAGMTETKAKRLQNGFAAPVAGRRGADSAGDSPDDQLACLKRELLRARRELVKKNLDLEKQRIEKFQELGMAVHGLRNPASGILSATEYLIQDDAEVLTEKQAALLQSVIKSTVFMLQMIEDVLDISAIESGKLKVDLHSTDLVSLVKEDLLVNKPEAERRGIRVDLYAAKPALIIDLDSIKMTQVIDNLLSNAIKFSPRDGRIEIRIAVKGNVASISVRDNGLGISADHVDAIFQPFHSRVNGKGPGKSGTGLGLAISRRIVEGHAGKITVKSEVGKGSTFTVNLPMVADAKAHPDPRYRRAPGQAAPQQQRRLAMGA